MKNYSVLLSVYHKEKTSELKEAIDSMLRQTAKTNDFVIVCDGPLTPELDTLLEVSFSENKDVINIVRLKENQGLGKALNFGIKQCKNEIIARMDADDIAFPKRCELQLKSMEKHNADMGSGTVIEFSGSIENLKSSRVLPSTHEEIMVFARRRNPFNHPCMMFKKSAVEKAGGYKHFHLCEDFYLWVRMLQSGAIGFNIEEPLLYMRAGDDMYQRRAGFKYLKSMMKFRWWMKKTGFSHWSDFIISSLGQAVVTLLPNSLRMKIYEKNLRKKSV